MRACRKDRIMAPAPSECREEMVCAFGRHYIDGDAYFSFSPAAATALGLPPSLSRRCLVTRLDSFGGGKSLKERLLATLGQYKSGKKACLRWKDVEVHLVSLTANEARFQ